jgi:hypothetical protein
MDMTGTPAEDRNDKSPAKRAWNTPQFAALNMDETAKPWGTHETADSGPS